MIDKLLFFASYPNNETIKDGLHQRIKSIDDECINMERTYLEISIKRNTIKYCEHKNNLAIYKLNLFIHFYLILKIITKFKYIYFHSIYYFIPLLLFNLKNKFLILDVHGVVPEEIEYTGKKCESKWLSFVEKRCFSIASKIICLSDAMRDHYRKKYPEISYKKYVIKPIINNNVFRKISLSEVTAIKSELKYGEDDVIFMYSGNLALYQNIELMLELSKKINANHGNCKFLFLTNDILTLQLKVNESSLTNATVLSVLPDKISAYYQISNYGFILRDDHILNRAASPTKMTEYLYYGLVPIVKSENIGDFLALDYERLTIPELLSKETFSPYKSKKNAEIVHKMVNDPHKVKISDLQD